MSAIPPGLLEGRMTDGAVNITTATLRLHWRLYKGEANQRKREGEYHPQEQSSQPSDHLQLSFIAHQAGIPAGSLLKTVHSRHF
jgi:hypothetical protein